MHLLFYLCILTWIKLAVELCLHIKRVLSSAFLIKHRCFPTYGVKWCTKWLNCPGVCSACWNNINWALCLPVFAILQLAALTSEGLSVPLQPVLPLFFQVPTCRVEAWRVFRLSWCFPGWPYYWPLSITVTADLTLILEDEQALLPRGYIYTTARSIALSTSS